MTTAVLADVHSNLPALEAVVADMRAHGAETVWTLGDVVGYGAEPYACLQILTDLDALLIAGNHELATICPQVASTFNPTAAEAISWTRGRIQSELGGLSSLPSEVCPSPSTILFHGQPGNTSAYIRTADNAAAVFESLRQRDPRIRLGLFGHTHRPMVFTRLGAEPVAAFEPGEELILAPGRRYLVNPGSVGQPRNGDPRAHYLLLDPDRKLIRFRKVPYDVAAAQDRILQAGLPVSLAARLSQGL